MKLRVLGCSGGELLHHRTTCFLVDGHLAIDAGALTGTLPLKELLEVSDILLTHAHLDHVKDVPLLADLRVGRRRVPVRVHASTQCARTLRRNVFNDQLWPDFTRIPNSRKPVVVIQAFKPSQPFRIGSYTVRPVPVSHTIESVGFIVNDGRSAFAVTGDTGPTTRFWRAVNQRHDLKALFVETSFPSPLQSLANSSGHLTPRTFVGELAKVKRSGFPIYVYHLKPAYEAELKRELAALKLDRVRVLLQGDELTF